MRKIMKVLPVPADGKSMDFRLTKPDAFSGASLLRTWWIDRQIENTSDEDMFVVFGP